MSIAVVTGGTLAVVPATESSNDDFERLAAYVREKYAYLIPRVKTGDPLVDELKELSPKFRRLSLPPLCGVDTSAYPMFIADVLPISHGAVRDMLVLAKSGQVFSLYEDTDINEFLALLGANCSSDADLQFLSMFYLRLTYAPEDPQWTPLRWCAAKPSEDGASCESPLVRSRRATRIYEGDVFAAREGGEPTWDRWSFEMRRSQFISRLERVE